MAADDRVDRVGGLCTSGAMHMQRPRRVRSSISMYTYMYLYLYLALYAAVLTLSTEDGAAWHGVDASSTQTASTWSELNQAAKMGRNTTVIITGDISWESCIQASGFSVGAYVGMSCQINITSPGITIMGSTEARYTLNALESGRLFFVDQADDFKIQGRATRAHCGECGGCGDCGDCGVDPETVQHLNLEP